VLLTREWYMHPNGQLPAYEWAFGDVNPPVHAWATWRVFQMDRKQRRASNPDDAGDLDFLERVFHKLMLNFTWWVNRKDAQGRNIFQGGSLGLDTSASLTAVRLSPPAASSTKPMAQVGWRCIHSTSCASLSNWQSGTRFTRTSRPSSL